MPDFPTKFIGLMAAQNNAMIFGVGSHRDSSNYLFPYSHDVIDELANNGYKYLVIEQPKSFQTPVDDFANNPAANKEAFKSSLPWHAMMNPEERAATLEQFSDTVKYAKSKGITILTGDPGPGAFSSVMTIARTLPDTTLGNFKNYLDAVQLDPQIRKISPGKRPKQLIQNCLMWEVGLTYLLQ